MKNKKGISPLISTVLIVGFTIVLAVLVISWINQTVNNTTDNTDCQVEAESLCLGVVGDLEMSNTGTAFTISNLGSTNLTEVKIVQSDAAGATVGAIDTLALNGFTSNSTSITLDALTVMVKAIIVFDNGECVADCSAVEYTRI